MKKTSTFLLATSLYLLIGTNISYANTGTLSNFDINDEIKKTKTRVSLKPHKPIDLAQPGILSKDSLTYRQLNSNLTSPFHLERSVIGPIDDRKVVKNVTGDPYNHITKVVCSYPDKSIKEGTGVIISSDSVLTAAHLLYDIPSKKFANKCEVVAGLTSSTTYSKGMGLSDKFLIPKKWISPKVNNDSDIGMIKLETKLGNVTGWMGLSTMLFKGETLETAGYPTDLNKNTMYNTKGKMIDYTDYIFYHDLDTYEGQSGSPIWNSAKLLVGLHTTSTSPDQNSSLLNQQYNKGIKFTEETYDYLLYWMNAYPGRVYGDSKVQVTINKENEKIWSNLALSIQKSSTTGLLGKEFHAKYYYNLPDGNKYLSLYDKNDILYGYINEKFIKVENK